jgi:hypothetical protein
MLEFTEISCPYCGENQSIDVDTSAGDQSYWQDCQVCCCPILCDLVIDARGAYQLLTRRDDE